MFQTSPTPSASQTLKINFYLKHFRNSTVSYILEKTGYTDITEYELLARSTDLFPAQITVNGFLTAERPEVDETQYAVFELSLHHLNWTVLDRIMTYYIGMNQTDYELLYPNYNTLYVYIPYKSSLVETEQEEENYDEEMENDEDETVSEVDEESESESEPEPEPVPVRKVTRRRIIVEESDSEDEEPQPLSGWVYTLNRATKNSYILRPQWTSFTVSNGIVYWGNQSQKTTWNAPIEGLDRPIYFNTKYEGWIVSLRLKDALFEAGARLI